MTKFPYSMTVTQLALTVFATAVGGQIILAPRSLIEKAGQTAWLSVLIGGIIYFLIAYMIIKIGQIYPQETFVSYMPKIWGGILGNFVIVYLLLIFFGETCLLLQGFTKIIKFFMFDKTPQLVIIGSMLLVASYCALQNLSVIIKVISILAFITSPILIIWVLGLQNFNYEQLLPLIPEKIDVIWQGTILTWNVFSGYEILLLFLPWIIYRQGSPMPVRAIFWTFMAMTALFIFIIIVIIGVLGSEDAKLFTVPAITVIKGVELPGTFIERLENYLMMFWIPLVFDTIAVLLFFQSYVLKELVRLSDHRLMVLVQLPIIFAVTDLLNRIDWYESAGKVITKFGVGFSLIVIPLTLLLAIWRAKKGAVI